MISAIIPTVNRPDALHTTLRSIQEQSVVPDEIIIIDQGDDDSNQKIVSQFSGVLKILLYKSTIKSLVHAKNQGVRHSQGDIICFLDDDVFLERDYFCNILEFFRMYPDALGVQGYVTNFEEGYKKKLGGGNIKLHLYQLFAKLFFTNRGGTINKMLRSGRVVYCSNPRDIIKCEWLSGTANFKRAVFFDFGFWFDEKMSKYCYGEDKLFSYRLHISSPGKLFLSPKIQFEHYPAFTGEGRISARELVMMRMMYSYYVWDNLMENTMINRMIFYWSLFGDLILLFIKSREWFCIALPIFVNIIFKSKKTLFEDYNFLFSQDAST